jgi:hypothetical protein
MNKTNLLQIRLDDFEKEFIKQRAHAHNYKKISEFVRDSMINPHHVPKKLLIDLCYQVNKVGVNLNQIARAANKHEISSPELLEEVRLTRIALEEILRARK